MRQTINVNWRFIVAILTSMLTLTANGADSVAWKAEAVADTDSTGRIVVTASVAEGYHFYSFAPDGGHNSLEIKAEGNEAVLSTGEPTASVAPEKHYEQSLGGELSSWSEDVSFEIPFSYATDKGYKIALKIRYQACDNTSCLTPKTVALTVSGNGYTEEDGNAGEGSAAGAAVDGDGGALTTNAQIDTQLWEPVKTATPTADQSPWAILVLGFLGGLAALLTPCVWPLIPMTLSFFLKQKKGGKFNKGALTYGGAIVIIYLVLGIAITLIFGAGKLNELSTNAIFNIIFFLLLVVFAISFFGAFDIKLPQKWSNAMDSKAESTSGIISIFFMAFTLVLVSFSCTGPIIGTLLVEAASQGNIIGPALGMGGFALGLAIPFTLFAFFPGMLKEMPKSGGWLNSVKVVLGFCELILSLKFLSVADMAYGWRILDREVFISLWIVMFVMLGLYLLGKLRFSHDEKKEHVGVGRFILSLFPLAFAVYLLPGLWGAPLKACSAFVPPLETQDFNLYTHETKYVEFSDYDEGMEYAREHGLPVLVDFSGYGCVNCRNMEAAVFDTDRVRGMLAEKYVVIKLMVDDKKELTRPMEVTAAGNSYSLGTVGEKWAFLQSYKFGANSQPYYIVLDNAGQPLTDPVYYDNNVDKFMEWLSTGLERYEAR
ncbi:MAG: cytochrome c biogenesis protein CcdA [Bacteroidales bacterium]|nr:cytochrome c biogenesis protein CcdA [Bacteroidales bacterium]